MAVVPEVKGLFEKGAFTNGFPAEKLNVLGASPLALPKENVGGGAPEKAGFFAGGESSSSSDPSLFRF